MEIESTMTEDELKVRNALGERIRRYLPDDCGFMLLMCKKGGESAIECISDLSPEEIQTIVNRLAAGYEQVTIPVAKKH